MPAKLSSPISAVDWKALYISRHLVDCATSQLLDSILTSQAGRIEKFQSVINLGYDAKDTLLRHISIDSAAEDYLARRFVASVCPLEFPLFLTLTSSTGTSYYAQALLTCLHRSIAIPEWARLRSDDAVPLIRALGAFDLFIPESGYGNIDEIKIRLNGIASRLSLNYPDIGKLSVRKRAKIIATYLRANNLTGIEPGREYHCLAHNFLGIALNDPGHNSLPLVSAAIYCHVAQRLGLNARPCGFPFHVHVIIMPPAGSDVDGNFVSANIRGEPIYMDPFRTDNETPVADLRSQLNFLGASPMEQTTFLDESWTSEIVLRCSKNILNSVQRITQFPRAQLIPVDVVCAKYAALWSCLLLSDPSRPAELRHPLLGLMELLATDFPSDIYLIEQYIAPIFHDTLEFEHIRENLHIIRRVDEIPKQVKQRSPEHKGVIYRVGQVFRHRRYNYTAIITGWDAECGAGDDWMRRMGIDRLQSGRHQSFYHVMCVGPFSFAIGILTFLPQSVEDKNVRYVAEENIQAISPDISELPPTLVAIAGKYFKRWDEVRREFVSNIKDEYPDD
ncbi:hypothetical protein AOCH_007190 [Aspergillus ochraceoroseus]|uniref:Hemimethylated DNA-binding domain-containing protein n=1 Tax=Aspergillus ochraceoroseus TaxID=138278 RepID=A0A0F8W4P1_9EURO|nr:hypothetical protein AOCH_007190 [Aspergillus ochraceoroseus]